MKEIEIFSNYNIEVQNGFLLWDQHLYLCVHVYYNLSYNEYSKKTTNFCGGITLRSEVELSLKTYSNLASCNVEKFDLVVLNSMLKSCTNCEKYHLVIYIFRSHRLEL